MFYDRQVKYFDYLIKKERCGNAGFVKLEVRGEVCNIHININGLEKTDSFPTKVYIASGEEERELCDLELNQGKGAKQLVGLLADNLAGTGISYQELEAFHVFLSSERELGAVLEKKVGQVNCSKELTAAAQERMQNSVEKQDERESIVETAVTENAELQNAIIDNIAEEETKEAEQVKQEPEPAEKKVLLHDEKWKQLWEIYPHIRPFRDGREYLSVGPGDFVVLPEKYYRVVNNSFLLHGYYNYKHLVLKKVEYRGEARYYIGVPGNFYDREKQVAVMFGFESFESLDEAAAMGEFGYYLMRIEL